MVRLLDLFCGAGGASMGYRRAGFDVEGVDIMPQPRYPFRFHQGDALEYVAQHGHEYDVIAASPPCQAYSRTRSFHTNEYPDLVAPCRNLLESLGSPYVIENVPGAPLINPIRLCGTMFGIEVYRHRLFESNVALTQLHHPRHTQRVKGYDNGGTIRGWDTGFITISGHNFPVVAASRAMQIEWMRKRELAQAIPPAYTEYIGRQLLIVNQDVDKNVDNPLANEQHS